MIVSSQGQGNEAPKAGLVPGENQAPASAVSQVATGLIFQKNETLLTKQIKNVTYLDPSDAEAIQAQIASLDKRLSEDPENLNLLIERANNYLNLKKYSEAEAEFQKVCSTDKTNPDANYGLGVIHLSRKQYVQARVRLNIANSKRPNNGFIISALAETYLGLGKLDEAKVLLHIPEQIEDNFTAQEDIVYTRVCHKILIAMNCLESAAKRLEDMDSFEDLKLRGNIESLNDCYPIAICFYKKLVNHPQCTAQEREYFMMQLAFNYLLDDQDSNYKITLQNLTKLYPETDYLDLLQGIYCQFQAGLPKAQGFLEKYLSKRPNDPIALFYLSKVFHEKREYTKAIECLDLILKFDPYNFSVVYEKATILYVLNDLQRALMEFERCAKHIDLDPKNPDQNLLCANGLQIYCYIALVKGHLGKKEEAFQIINTLNMHVIPDLNISLVKQTSAQIYFKFNEYEKSLELLNEALKWEPKNKFLLKFKASILLEMGSYDNLKEAIDICNQKDLAVIAKSLKEAINAKLKANRAAKEELKKSKSNKKAPIKLENKPESKISDQDASEVARAREAEARVEELKRQQAEELKKQQLAEEQLKLEKEAAAKMIAEEIAAENLRISAQKKAEKNIKMEASGSSRKKLTKKKESKQSIVSEFIANVEDCIVPPSPTKTKTSNYVLPDVKYSLEHLELPVHSHALIEKVSVVNAQEITYSHPAHLFTIAESTKVVIPSKTVVLAKGILIPSSTRLGPELIQNASNTINEIDILLSEDVCDENTLKRILVRQLRSVVSDLSEARADYTIAKKFGEFLNHSDFEKLKAFVNSKGLLISLDQINKVCSVLARSKFGFYLGRIADTNVWPQESVHGIFRGVFTVPVVTDENLIKAIEEEFQFIRSLGKSSPLNNKSFKISVQLIQEAVSAIQDVGTKSDLQSKLSSYGLNLLV